jgi:Arc/MetJ-type ribon-helix-helix transcriptional regulator
MEEKADQIGIDFYWIRLGEGGRVVRFCGWVYERVVALHERRRPLSLYHSALQVFVEEGRYAIESAPVVDELGEKRGVVAVGQVGAKWAGRWRIFRYELRRWKEGVIPDLAEAVESPRRLSNSSEVARKLLELMEEVPNLVWGRDEIKAGEMWNSNSQMAWLLEKSGLEAEKIEPPKHGRAIGWKAGVVAARREAR